ncbi:MAG: CDP-alcohol phosphatidyltransferase family protein [Deltaproteobacteria bacterium]|nr:CDP-alcohol phosphatidyltransferase family protein [Deltaproteobacteria bacterium]
MDLDAIVLADGPLSRVRIAGLSARERAVRVARKVGATRVHVIDGPDRSALRGLRPNAVLVIRADQLVHTGLVQPLIEANDDAAAVVPDHPPVEDLTPGFYAGALIVVRNAAGVIDALLAGLSDTDIAADIAQKIPHGPIARAPIATREQRRAAHRLLYRILVKPQDNAITRYLYRPVSFPLTRALVWTPITPNQISYLVAALVALGCWITAHASMNMALLGTVIVLAASYLDCCDGEVARVKLLSSRFGAWIDTVVDELSSVGYMIAIGWHCHLAFGPRYLGDLRFDPWKAAIVVSTVTFLWSIYCIYYNIIVAVGSANSQDYVGRFEVVPGRAANAVRLAPAAPKAIVTKRELPAPVKWLATYAPYVVRRDFISWAAVLCAALHWTHIAFAALVAGGLVTFVIVSVDHARLRSLRRSIAKRGLVLEAP